MLQIPDRYVKALEKLRQLPDESFQELLDGISRVALSSSRDQLTNEACNFISSIKPKDIETLVALLSLKGAQDQAEESDDFVENLLSAHCTHRGT